MTLIQIGLERNVEGRTLAWALDYPGVFTYGADDAEAILRMPREMLRFESWLNLRTDYPWVRLEGLDVHIDEIFEVFPVDDEGEIYEVNAFFRSDLLPLSAEEIQKALQIYDWQREELLAGVETLPKDLLSGQFEGQRWTIEGSWSISRAWSGGTSRALVLRYRSLMTALTLCGCSRSARKALGAACRKQRDGTRYLSISRKNGARENSHGACSGTSATTSIIFANLPKVNSAENTRLKLKQPPHLRLF